MGNLTSHVVDKPCSDGVYNGLYTGEWHYVYGPEGQGKLTLFDPENKEKTYTREGQWKNIWDFTGYGSYKYSNDSIYTGEFVNNKRHGKGKLVQTDDKGVEYIMDGDWNKDQFTGYGSYKHTKGYTKMDSRYPFIYEGNWKNGYFHGKGKFIQIDFDNEYICEGLWNMNKFTGNGAFKNYTYIYKGDFVNGNWHGYGTLINPRYNISTKKTGYWYRNNYLGPTLEDEDRKLLYSEKIDVNSKKQD